jgi:hypothetical protein
VEYDGGGCKTCTSQHETMTFCADRSSKNEQLSGRPFLWKTKNTNVEGGWKLKPVFCFMETIYEPLHLDK